METNKDIYDIIIENTEKEWYSSMLNQIPKEKWEVPKYSKSQINKAGTIIINPDSSADERSEALQILNNWRSSHAYPLQVIASNLRRNNKNAIVVQRLKRLDSITGKLERFPDMNLYRMQDLGGCRVIVDTIDQVYDSLNKYKNSRIRHILKREDDYIQNPKSSGYRSYHMVYQFHSDDKDTYNKNMRIEIQFRTKLQHIWATAVEMMGIYTKSQLKSSMGDQDVLRFFVLVSSIFATMEHTPLCPNTPTSHIDLIGELKELDRKLNIISKLSALSVAIELTNNNAPKKGYYILVLHYEKGTLDVYHYHPSEIELATRVYNTIEANNDKSIDAVLVSANSFDTLKIAYPNYFTDISEFNTIMREIISW